jgi:hypothetical protein
MCLDWYRFRHRQHERHLEARYDQVEIFARAGAKSSTSKIESVGDNMKVTIDTVNADGTSLHSEWVGKYDGKDYPVKGDPNSDMRSYTRVDDYTMQATAKKASKVTLTTKTVYSKDGKSRTGTQTGTNAQGQKVNNTIVSIKQ